jgi:hypothetical protein
VTGKIIYGDGPHDRMPVIIQPRHFDSWLKNDDSRSEMHKAAMNFPEDAPIKIYPVSDLVNSPKTDDPRCIEPVQIGRDFFCGNGVGIDEPQSIVAYTPASRSG